MAKREVLGVSAIGIIYELLEDHSKGTGLNRLVGQPHAGKREEQKGTVFTLEAKN